ncbi:MAG: hypothetical protein IJW63_08050 [Lachnospiraceae bacterium]|nr:hypothetical protein [Lachnospiraceae bacterium]
MEKTGFNYTYSAKEQDEVKRIREKYADKQENKMEQLRRLDQKVTQKGTMMAIIIGVIGTLIMGVGMCCTLVWQGVWFVAGIIIGLLGMAVLGIAYPVYLNITKKEREKYGPEILRLADELMK